MLVLAGFLLGTVNDRRLMHEARVDLAVRSHLDLKRENTNAFPSLDRGLRAAKRNLTCPTKIAEF